MAVDALGNVYFAQSSGGDVRKILPDGTIVTVASGLNSPYGVAVDGSGKRLRPRRQSGARSSSSPSAVRPTTSARGYELPDRRGRRRIGNVYVADYGASQVDEIKTDGTVVPIGSGWDRPSGVAVDAAGDVFVADTGNNQAKEQRTDGTIVPLGSVTGGATDCRRRRRKRVRGVP